MIDRPADREAPVDTRDEVLTDRELRPPAANLIALLFAFTAIGTMVLLTLGPVGLRYRLNLTALLCLGTRAVLLRAAHRETETAPDPSLT